ncbi:MAG: zinc-dependent alcohol dehydrogenase family protein [candidate division WOR-3 bacterium]
MKALLLRRPAPVEQSPLELTEVPTPTPRPGEALVQVSACGICHTDLHTVEGDLQLPVLPIIPGHQVVGTVQEIIPRGLPEGDESTCISRPQAGPNQPIVPGSRVGIPWLSSTCGKCRFCRSGRENLCPEARFTGLHVNGGYAQYAVTRPEYAVPLPDGLPDCEAAPLLCAGIIGLRALRRANLPPKGRVGLFGFGASAHVVLQIARYWGCSVFVFTRSQAHRALATELGAEWVGESSEPPPDRLDAAIIFAPVGDLVKTALEYLDRGGVVVTAGIHSSPIPMIDYPAIYQERTITSVANSTREDALELIRLGQEIPIRTRIEVYPMEAANEALRRLRAGRIQGAAVLKIA